MSPQRTRWLCAAAAILTQAAAAGTVTVAASVSSAAGDSAEDTVIVFDPLDGVRPSSRDTAVIDQVNKKFVPRVSVLRTGTAVTFPNSDHIRHQVYSFSSAKKFTLKLYAGSPPTAITFDQPGLVVLGCNIHDKMVAFVVVVDSPYFAKLNASGSAAVDLPPGHYRLRAWNPTLAGPIAPQDITVQSAPLTIPLAITLNSASVAVAPWPE